MEELNRTAAAIRRQSHGGRTSLSSGGSGCGSGSRPGSRTSTRKHGHGPPGGSDTLQTAASSSMLTPSSRTNDLVRTSRSSDFHTDVAYKALERPKDVVREASPLSPMSVTSAQSTTYSAGLDRFSGKETKTTVSSSSIISPATSSERGERRPSFSSELARREATLMSTDMTEEKPDEDNATSMLLSRLLARRPASKPLAHLGTSVDTPAYNRGRRKSTGSVPLGFEPMVFQKKIRQLKVDEKIFDLYCWEEVLQEEGDGGKVVVCRHKGDGEDNTKELVMKMRSKTSLAERRLSDQFRKAQLRLLNLPSHAGVVPLCEVLEDDKFYYIIMEKASGGSFFSSLLTDFTDGNMPAKAVRKVMKEILEAVGYVHKQGVLHRDIKPDNLVMQVSEDCLSPTGKVKKVALIDFDYADADWNPRTPTLQLSFCGTVRFSAPEAFAGRFSQPSDLYSVGVILYLLMTGKMPYGDDVFKEDNVESPSYKRNWQGRIIDRLKVASIDWECSPWPEQRHCMDLCQDLLEWDPADRPQSAEEALSHDWFTSA